MKNSTSNIFDPKHTHNVEIKSPEGIERVVSEMQSQEQGRHETANRVEYLLECLST